MSTPWTGARCSSLLATLTVSPITVVSAVVPIVPRCPGPVLIPTRIATSMPDSAANAASRSCSARPARTARSGSSSRVASAPHTAISASPMCLSIRPPWLVTTTSSRVQMSFIIADTNSASMCSDIAVNPLTSANNTVTCRRRGAAASSVAS